MASGGSTRESSAALASTMVDLQAANRPAHGADESVFKERWKPSRQDWLFVGLVVAAVASLIALVIWLP